MNTFRTLFCNKFTLSILAVTCLSTLLASELAQAQSLKGAKWIWSKKVENSDETIFLRKKVELPQGIKKSVLLATCDNSVQVFLNGKRVISHSQWETAAKADVTKLVKPGFNIISVQAKNNGGPGGFILSLNSTLKNGKKLRTISDKSWTFSHQSSKGWKGLNYKVPGWIAATELGNYGMQPWGSGGTVRASAGQKGAATDPKSLKVAKGFKVELLYEVPKAQQGSWVSITTDPKGRLITSDQYGALYRVTPPKLGGKAEDTKVEKLDIEIGAAQGLLHAFNSLYVVINGKSHGKGSGLYRVFDTNGDDQYDKIVKLKDFRGGGEHGPHAVIKTSDGKGLFVIGGNHTDVPSGLTSSKVPQNWAEDLLLPRQWDARGHARGKLAPGGWVCRTDPEGKTWDLISIGYRNQYDIGLNRHGELFTYDADMEWDLGTPWYRPTRVNHVTSGSEFGWRSGTGKWPEYYPDSLPATINIGPGCPTGVVFGTGAKFPARYQDAFYICDWTFGTLYAIHLIPDGASYKATKTEFVAGRPLPLTDLTIGHDGSMYFMIGGRRTQSALYRVTYTGKESTAAATHVDAKHAELRALRKKIEGYHKKDPKAVDAVWQYLGHSDRFIRYAARVALEHQPAKSWQGRLFEETDAQTIISATVALARVGDSSVRDQIIDTLGSNLSWADLNNTERLEGLRALGLVFIRMGKPDDEIATEIANALDQAYPSGNDLLDRELANLLVYLDGANVVEKTLALMKSSKNRASGGDDLQSLIARNSGYGGAIQKMLGNQPHRQNIHFAFALRNVRFGWTLEQRREYFKWFPEAMKASGGASFQGFLRNIRKEAIANCSQGERQALTDLTGEKLEAPSLPKVLPKPKGPGKEWKLAELTEITSTGLTGRNFENGKKMYLAATCAGCHRFDGLGGALGPDLTNLASRFSVKDVLESITDPSKVVSDQYASSTLVTTAGQRLLVRVLSSEGDKLTVAHDPKNPSKSMTLNRSDVLLLEPSKDSLMPADLFNTLNKEEVLDLMAYLLSRGDSKDKMFK